MEYINIAILILGIIIILYVFRDSVGFNYGHITLGNNNSNLMTKTDGFQNRLRPISGPNIITSSVVSPNGSVREIGQYYAKGIWQPLNEKGKKHELIWDGNSRGIAPGFSGTIYRDTRYSQCPEGKGYACPCDSGITKSEYHAMLHGY